MPILLYFSLESNLDTVIFHTASTRVAAAALAIDLPS